MAADDKRKVTVLKLRRQKKEGQKTVIVTAYDYPQAIIADGCRLHSCGRLAWDDNSGI